MKVDPHVANDVRRYVAQLIVQREHYQRAQKLYREAARKLDSQTGLFVPRESAEIGEALESFASRGPKFDAQVQQVTALLFHLATLKDQLARAAAAGAFVSDTLVDLDHFDSGAQYAQPEGSFEASASNRDLEVLDFDELLDALTEEQRLPVPKLDVTVKLLLSDAFS